MAEWGNLGKLFIGIGAAIMVVGGLILLADRSSGVGSFLGWLGKLPGDIYIKRDNFTFFFPLGTSIVLSIVLSLVFYIASWIFRR
ncbi:DUF2905 domain-containing protein [Petrachloros mirabilis]